MYRENLNFFDYRNYIQIASEYYNTQISPKPSTSPLISTFQLVTLISGQLQQMSSIVSFNLLVEFF